MYLYSCENKEHAASGIRSNTTQTERYFHHSEQRQEEQRTAICGDGLDSREGHGGRAVLRLALNTCCSRCYGSSRHGIERLHESTRRHAVNLQCVSRYARSSYRMFTGVVIRFQAVLVDLSPRALSGAVPTVARSAPCPWHRVLRLCSSFRSSTSSPVPAMQ